MSRRYRQWFNSLKPGDKCRIQFPWVDGNHHGGLVVTATVAARQPMSEKRKSLSYRTKGWGRRTRAFPMLDSYSTVMPIDKDAIYDPSYGFKLYKFKNGKSVWGIKRKKNA